MKLRYGSVCLRASFSIFQPFSAKKGLYRKPMTMRCILLISWFLLVSSGCSKETLDAGGDYVKARVMYVSCGGTVLQFIKSTNNLGKDWLWFKNKTGPFDSTNPAETYPECVTAFDIPAKSEVVGDTLEFTYSQLQSPRGTVCAIGGLPNVYISVRQLRKQ